MSQQLVPQQLSHAMDFDQALDTDNPRSLINIVPGNTAKAILAIPGEAYELSVEDLKKRVTKNKQDDENLELLRTAWWLEYNRAQKTITKFNMGNVYGGICYKANFLREYIGNSFNLLYIMTPPVDYQVQQHRILNLAFAQEIAILKMPHLKPVYNKEGEMIGEEVDSKLLAVQQKISDSMRNRLMGMPVNRTMQVNQNINHNSSDAPSFGGKPMEKMDEAELQAMVDDLKGENGIDNNSKLESDGEVIDVGGKKP